MNQGFSVLIFLHYSVMVLQAHMSPGGWTIGPLMVTVQRRSLTP
jgi:hypothetical protein